MAPKKGSMSGEKNPAWKGGIINIPVGYVAVYCPNHPYKSKGKNPWVYQHRLVVEESLGRYLEPTEIVHHINEDKSDNRIENLMLVESNSAHVRMHMQMRRDHE